MTAKAAFVVAVTPMCIFKTDINKERIPVRDTTCLFLGLKRMHRFCEQFTTLQKSLENCSKSMKTTLHTTLGSNENIYQVFRISIFKTFKFVVLSMASTAEYRRSCSGHFYQYGNVSWLLYIFTTFYLNIIRALIALHPFSQARLSFK